MANNARELTKEEAETLERIMDSTSLYHVVAAVADICHGKAQHIEENWQDAPLAARWNKNGKIIEKARASLVSVA